MLVVDAEHKILDYTIFVSEMFKLENEKYLENQNSLEC